MSIGPWRSAGSGKAYDFWYFWSSDMQEVLTRCKSLVFYNRVHGKEGPLVVLSWESL